MLKQLRLMIFVALLTMAGASPSLAQSDAGGGCAIPSMMSSMADAINARDKIRIEDTIRPTIKLMNLDCLRGILNFGGFNRLRSWLANPFFNLPNIGDRLCHAILERVTDNTQVDERFRFIAAGDPAPNPAPRAPSTPAVLRDDRSVGGKP